MKKNIVIIILIILILGLSGYLIYDKLLLSTDNEVIDNKESNNNKEENNNNKEDDEKDDLKNAKFILDKYLDSDMHNIIERIAETKLNEETKLAIVINSIESDNTEEFANYQCSELFESLGEYGSVSEAFSKIGWTCGDHGEIPYKHYSYIRVNDKYKEFFGSLDEAPKQDILYDKEAYAYSDIKDVYVKLTPQFGPIISNSYYYEVEEVLTNDNEIKIKISYLTYKVNLFVEEISYNINNTEYLVNSEEDLMEVYNNNKNLLPVLTFVFENNNNNYILKYVE